MKNLQKGSIKICILLVIIVIVILGISSYLLDTGTTCRTTDVYGNSTTTQGPCPRGKADSVSYADDPTGINKAIRDQISTYLPEPPKGFLQPTTVPSGYKLVGGESKGVLFEANFAGYYYSTNRGVPKDKNITFEEKENPQSAFGNYDLYIAYVEKEANRKVVKEFNYNGAEGKVYTYPTSSSPNHELAYNHEGRLLTITAVNDPNVTPDILIDLLKSMKVSK